MKFPSIYYEIILSLVDLGFSTSMILNSPKELYNLHTQKNLFFQYSKTCCKQFQSCGSIILD